VTVPCTQVEIGALRDDIAPALMRSPLSLEETVQRYVRPHLREVAINLCQQPVAEYLNRFDFRRCVPSFQEFSARRGFAYGYSAARWTGSQ